MPILLALLFACPHPDAIDDLVDAPVTSIDNDPLADVSVPARPLWTDKYSKTEADMGRFFRIDALMNAHDLTRLQAIELQNHFRDLERSEPAGGEFAHFQEALRRATAGAFESGLDRARLEGADFIVIFDLDDTLYDQYYSDVLAEECHTVRFEQDGRPKSILMNPGWESVLRAIDELGGASVIFSANRDEPTLDNLSHIQLDGAPLVSSPLVAGVMTNSYLMLQHKDDGRPVVEPSKDVRLVDETLGKVIIVDDNPTRLFQPANTRLVKKFDADAWCAVGPDDPTRRALESEMPAIEQEIRTAVHWTEDDDIPFAAAYRPFTQTGRAAAGALMRGNQWTFEEAARYIVEHPESVDGKF